LILPPLNSRLCNPGDPANGGASDVSDKDPTCVPDDAEPTTSKEVLEPTPAEEAPEGTSPNRRQCNLKLSGQLFLGVVEASKRGIHPVIRYPIPGGNTCYAFEYVRTTKRGQLVVYRCTRCKKNGYTTSIAVQNGNEFIGDPTEIPHVCTPLKNAQDKVTRMVYQSCQAIATDPQLAEAKPSQLWKSIAQFIDDNAPDDEAERETMLRHFYKGGFKSRRRSIARAAAKLHDSGTTKRTNDQKKQPSKSFRTLLRKCSS
ncbi:hypothetical protein COOONC_27420, partial [Cooperia oncophora]